MIFQVSRLFHSSSKKQFCNSTKKVTGAKAAGAVYGVTKLNARCRPPCRRSLVDAIGNQAADA
jgi:hypothetical protein